MGENVSMVELWAKKEVFTMGHCQIHKRRSPEFVKEVLEAFNESRITEEMACELLGIR